MTKAMFPSPHIDWNERCVYLITSSDGGVLFDLDHDEFLKLDPIATEMWTLLSAGKREAEVVEHIAGRYSADQNRVALDLKNFVQSAAARGITPGCVHLKNETRSAISSSKYPTYPWYGQDANARRPVPTRLTVLRALFGLALFDLTLSARSLKSLCRLVSEWPLKTSSKTGDSDLIGRICTAVERACVWYPKKAVCLQRSAVTACLLKSIGIRAELIVGARVMPMVSHAWVEVDGSVINDHPKVKNVFRPMASF